MARIVFDLDGTLIDSVLDIAAAANLTLAEVGAAPLSVHQARSFVGAGAVVFVERMARARGLDHVGRLVPRFEYHYERSVDQTAAFAGVEMALADLRRAGHAIGLCTNKPARPTAAVLAHLQWTGMFDVVISGDSLTVRKPEPEPLWAAFDGLGGGSAKIYVGDSEVDAETAARAGVPFLLFTKGYRTAAVNDLPHAAAFDDWAQFPGVVDDLALEQPTGDGAGDAGAGNGN